MNTPIHGLLSAALLDREPRPRDAVIAFLAGVAPDVPAAIFFLVFGVLRGQTELSLWTDHFFGSGWDLAGDYLHSIVLAGALLGLALWRRWRTVKLIALALLLHALIDLPTHGIDAHRHFLPLSDWRFHSPVSYWDPSKGGYVFLSGEALLLGGCQIACFRRYRQWWIRGAALAVGAFWLFWILSGLAVWEA